MKKIFLCFFILLFSSCCYAIASDIGLDPLDETGTARPQGMGGAFTGMYGDINSLFYNPAGIAYSKGLIISGRGMNEYSIGVDYDMQVGNFAVGLVSKNYKGIPIGTVEAEYEQSMALVGYAIDFGRFSVGLLAKSLLSQNFSLPGSADATSSAGFDMDAGIMYRPFDYMSIGIVSRNVTANTYTIGRESEKFPQSTRFGLSLGLLGMDSIFYNDTYGMKIAYDIENGKVGDDNKQNSFVGSELSFNDWLFIRFGGNSVYFNGENVNGGSAGLGIKIVDMRLDIASIKEPITQSQLSFMSVTYSPPVFTIVPKAEVKKPKIAPSRELLALSSPQDDYATYDESVAVEGKTDPKASVTINGVSAYVAEDGSFKAMQTLNPGKNLIEIQSKLDKETKMMTRKVLRKAKVVIAEEENINKKISSEVTNKEQELIEKENQIKKDKEKGIDVSAREEELKKEKEAYQLKKTQLYDEKNKMEERRGKVENLATLGVIEVSPDKKFEIESPIKRGEMISWLVKAAGLPVPKVEVPVFSDVPANHPYAPYIKAALDAGVIIKHADDKFRPDDPVTEQEGQAFFKAFGVIK